ncbi:hypothetical protein B0H14DRAFT_2632244 [Mycena olivaceomarginata]|nr:hypothetical protein B0H14DRAFT_2632244 [Mycena olivaceomarginata]
MTKRIDGLENAVTESTKATAATLTARPNPAMPPQPDARGNDGPTNITALGPTFNLKKGGPGPTKTVTNPMNARQHPASVASFSPCPVTMSGIGHPAHKHTLSEMSHKKAY